MNNEEARRILLSDADFSGTGEKAKLTADALCVAVDALDKADKYAWHDLRKNPNDLPKRDGRYSVNVMLSFCAGVHEGVYAYEDAVMHYGPVDEYSIGSTIIKAGSWVSHHATVHPIAWRYIEPFEEEGK